MTGINNNYKRAFAKLLYNRTVRKNVDNLTQRSYPIYCDWTQLHLETQHRNKYKWRHKNSTKNWETKIVHSYSKDRGKIILCLFNNLFDIFINMIVRHKPWGETIPLLLNPCRDPLHTVSNLVFYTQPLQLPLCTNEPWPRTTPKCKTSFLPVQAGLKEGLLCITNTSQSRKVLTVLIIHPTLQ